jgi:hypothetical protein
LVTDRNAFFINLHDFIRSDVVVLREKIESGLC